MDVADIRWAFIKRAGRLPTLETQLVEWFRFLGDFGARLHVPFQDTCDLQRSGFKLYARSGYWVHGAQSFWGLTLAKFEILPKFRGRGWFRNFIEITYHCMPHDVLVLEQVQNRELASALLQKPAYRFFNGKNCVRWDSKQHGEFGPAQFWQTDFDTFVRMGGKIVRPDYCPAVVNFPGYKPAPTTNQEWTELRSSIIRSQGPQPPSSSDG